MFHRLHSIFFLLLRLSSEALLDFPVVYQTPLSPQSDHLMYLTLMGATRHIHIQIHSIAAENFSACLNGKLLQST